MGLEVGDGLEAAFLGPLPAKQPLVPHYQRSSPFKGVLPGYRNSREVRTGSVVHVTPYPEGVQPLTSNPSLVPTSLPTS
jgi:hypothetical protein